MNFLAQKLRSGFVLFGIIILVVAHTSTADAQSLDRIQQSGVIRLGFQADARPFSYSDESGNAQGYSMALCRKVADAVKSELKLSDLRIQEVMLSSTERFRAVEEGRIDMLCGATTETLTGRRTVSFSMPIFLSGIGALVRADAPSQLRALLAGEEPRFRPRWRASYAQILQQRTFSAHTGTTAAGWLTERKAEFGIIATIAPVAHYEDGIRNVLNHKADVFFGDRAILLDAALHSPGGAGDLTVSPRLFTHETIALVLPRGDEDFRLLVDRTLSELYRSGEITDLYTIYFGAPDDSALTLFSWAALPD